VFLNFKKTPLKLSVQNDVTVCSLGPMLVWYMLCIFSKLAKNNVTNIAVDIFLERTYTLQL